MSKQRTRNRDVHKRHLLLIERVEKDNFYPTKQQLLDFLEQHDQQISPRTLDRTLQTLRNDFGIEIIYSTTYRGYYIDKKASLDINTVVKILELIDLSTLVNSSLQESKKTLHYISFGSRRTFVGLDNLKKLLDAIMQGQEVAFNHENYISDKFTDYTVKPILLREYLSRWYLIGIPNGLQEYRTFGIDRMHNINFTGKSFKQQDQHIIKQNFEEVIGLNYSDETTQEVLLLCTPLQARYFKSQPLHSSQKIVEETSEGCTFRLVVRPNYELQQTILMYGDQIEVLVPQSLRNKIKQTVTIMHAKYAQ